MALTTGYIDEGMMPQLLRVTSSMGLTVDTGLIIEGSAQHHLNRYPHYLLPDAESHEITDAIIDSGYYILTPLAQPLVESGEGSATVTWLLDEASATALTLYHGTEPALTLLLGASADDGSYYARLPGSAMVYTIEASAPQTLLNARRTRCAARRWCRRSWRRCGRPP